MQPAMLTTFFPLLPRLVLALIFLYHGAIKVRPSTHYGLEWQEVNEQAEPLLKETKHLDAGLQAVTAWSQLLAGLALAVGFLPRLAAGGLIAMMLGDAVINHADKGFSVLNNGWEYNFLVIVLAVEVVLLGAGPFALGRWVGFRRPRSGGVLS